MYPQRMQCLQNLNIYIFRVKMPQAWQAKLTPKELKVFETLYEDARIEDGLYRAMFRLMMNSKAPGMVIIFYFFWIMKHFLPVFSLYLLNYNFNWNKLKRLTSRDKFKTYDKLVNAAFDIITGYELHGFYIQMEFLCQKERILPIPDKTCPVLWISGAFNRKRSQLHDV